MAAAQERHLMVHPPGAGPPTALRVEPPAVRLHAPDTPPLRRGDRGEQVQRVVAMALDHVLVDIEQEAGLVIRVYVAVAPDRILEPERVHVGLAGDLVDR